MSLNVLPSNVINLINEYSKPITRSDWRTLHKMTNYNLYTFITEVINKRVTLALIIQTNIKDSEWYILYTFTQCWGIENTSKYYFITIEELLKIDGIIQAVSIHKNRMNLTRMKRQYSFIQ
jgi:hypothetical protein